MSFDLTVLSLNLWNINEPFAERMHAFSSFLEATAPDVLCLQEVPARQGVLMLPDSIGELGYECFYLPTGDISGHEEGNAICTRPPATLVGAVPLPGGSGDLARGALAVRLDESRANGSDRALIVTTHLAYKPEQSDVRRSQALEIAQMLARLWSNFGQMPTIVAGDLNCTDESDVLRILTNPVSGHWLKDAQAEYGQAHRFTFDAENQYVSPDLWPNRRIDYVLVSSEWHLIDFDVVVNSNSSGSLASDHYGLLAKVRMPAADLADV